MARMERETKMSEKFPKMEETRLEGMYRWGDNYLFVHHMYYEGDEKWMPFDFWQVTMSTNRGWVPLGELDPETGNVGNIKSEGSRWWVDDICNLSTDCVELEEFNLEI